MGLKIGICGVSKFGRKFVALFAAHPDVDEVVLADVRTARLHEVAGQHGITRTVSSLDELCRSDVNAVALFTQRWTHAPQVVQALRAGKHVYSAVPAAVTLDELAEVVRTVEATGLIYMLAETGYYHPHSAFCRRRYADGDFGDFVYGEGGYYHDMAHFYRSFWLSNDDWKPFASLPPMFYPTHSTSQILGITFRRMTEVSCFGQVDRHPDGIFDEDLSYWNNSFSNQSALFRTSDGGTARINEFRRIGHGTLRVTLLGTRGAFEQQTRMDGGMADGDAVWTRFEQVADNPGDGVFDYRKEYLEKRHEDVSRLMAHDDGVEITEENLGGLPRECLGRRHLRVSAAHPIERIPKEFVGLPNDHFGSHQFLVLDFVEALSSGKLPPNNVWQAARYNAPGLVAHESARRGGELLKIPDFGTPPADWSYLDPETTLRD